MKCPCGVGQKLESSLLNQLLTTWPKMIALIEKRKLKTLGWHKLNVPSSWKLHGKIQEASDEPRSAETNIATSKAEYTKCLFGKAYETISAYRL